MSSRITSNMLSSNYLRNMKRNMNNMQALQNQLASGKAINKASDNPYVASRSMQLNAEISYNKQYDENIKDTSNWLDTTDTALSQMGNIFGRIETLLVNSGNGAYGDDERAAIRDEVKEKVNELSQILNTSFDGSYIFGGTKTNSKPTIVVNGVLEYADKDGNAIEITAYKDSAGNITNDKSSTQNMLVGAISTLTPDPTSDLNAELTNSSTSADRKADIQNLLNGATAYYNGAGVAPSPIPASQLTSEKYVTNLGASSLTDAQKNALITERSNSTTSEARKEDITKILQGGQVYERIDPSTRLGTGVFTSDKYSNTQIILSATDIKNLKNELSNPSTSTSRINDINSVLYNNSDNGSGTLSLANISAYEQTLNDTTASVAAKNAAMNALNGASRFAYLTQIGSDLNVDISQGISSKYNKTAIDIMEFKDKNGKTINVSSLLNDIVADLGGNGNTGSLTTTHLSDIQAVTANLLQKRSEVGTLQSRMDSAQQNNETQNYNMTDILSKTEDIDFAETTMNYSMMQTVYTAALQTSAKILPMTILTYL